MASDDDPGTLRTVVRSVSPRAGQRRDTEMNTIGWGLALGLVIVLLPLLPVLIIVWVLVRLLDRIDPRD